MGFHRLLVGSLFMWVLWGTGAFVRAQDDLSLDQAIARALENNPEINASRARVTAAQGLLRQSQFRPNPVFTFQAENVRFWGSPSLAEEDLDLFAYMSQPLEGGGKRKHRLSLAQWQRELASLEAKTLEWRIRQRVKLAFLEALLAQKELGLLEENTGNFEQITEYHRIRVQEGAMAEADLIKVRLEQQRFEMGLSEALINAERTRLNLFKVMGSTDSSPSARLLDLPAGVLPRGGVSLETLVEMARSGRPEVQMARADLERARANLSVQGSLSNPDWNVILGYKRSDGYNTLLGGLSLPLPFFDKNQGRIDAASSEIDSARAVLESRLRQVRAEVEMAVKALQRRHAMLKSMEEGMLDRAEESWQISLSAYQEGATDLLRLLDAQKVRNEGLLLHVRTQLEYEMDKVELESAVGQENLPIGEELLSVSANN